jgi:hypothetical protein
MDSHHCAWCRTNEEHAMAEGEWKKTAIRMSMYNLALASELRHVLGMLAQHHGGAAGPWLDALEARAVDGIKSLDVQGLDIQIEAEALQGALTDMTALFAGVRASLA